MQIYGSNELVSKVQKQGLCIGCGACVELCPYFKNHKGQTAMVFPCTLPQGLCFAHCPKIEVDFDELSQRVWGKPYDGSPMGNYLKVQASQAGEKMGQGNYQGGGTVSALLIFAMQEGIIDAAVLTDHEKLNPIARLATTVEEIQQCAGSKFMASPTLSALNIGVRKGYRRLGVVGTPCQMLAVAQLRQNPLEKQDFVDPVALSIGVFCNWALDTRQLMALLKQKLDIGTIRAMDIPPPPANIMILSTDEGRVEVPLSEVKELIPHTCFICLDMTAEFSDISVGMFEGRPGWNTLIVRSRRGADMVDRAV
ncbi:MAG: Coenzyme F420 hydrogenase/dehydrogenase, beta subunit C-terminal domain, partial [Deltaproteobacteria bacterium]|nr:Coenzyme F420 hydrogenase/dehydrogenase, beta subunit C-terminal domain [Deltaproteobacteria bacterium]